MFLNSHVPGQLKKDISFFHILPFTSKFTQSSSVSTRGITQSQVHHNLGFLKCYKNVISVYSTDDIIYYTSLNNTVLGSGCADVFFTS